MIDLDKGTNILNKADGFLTSFGIILKKHWGKLLLIGIGVVFYWFGNEVLKEMDKETTTEHIKDVEPFEEGSKTHKEEYTIIKETFFIDKSGYRKGDTVYVDYYDDGFIDKYYKSGGETYIAD